MVDLLNPLATIPRGSYPGFSVVQFKDKLHELKVIICGNPTLSGNSYLLFLVPYLAFPLTTPSWYW
jgi:hypothetical protein